MGFIVLSLIVFVGLVFFFMGKLQAPTANVALGSSDNSVLVPVAENALEKVAAIVGDKKIFVSEIEKRLKVVPAELAGQVTKKGILDNMIEGELLLQEAQKNNVAVEDAEVENVFLAQKESISEIISLGGFSEEEIKKSIKESLVVQKFLQEIVFAQLQASEEEVTKFFEENKDQLVQVSASHILVDSEEKAKELLGKLKEGADFAALAKENSTDKVSGENGGKLGFFSRGEVVKEFADAAFSLKPGELSDVVKSQFGYHIILLEEIKDAPADFLDQIKQALLSQKQNQAYTEILEQLKQETQVQILLEEN
ncbi:MAG: peptidylprolyl isomerase [Candidatus Diapherotrites archaeon]|nr:peptidylprolyl isomerase [Candidatus Diapherotrites archaeon]